jgi:hypothetical protein
VDAFHAPSKAGDSPFVPGIPLLTCHTPFTQPKIFPEARDKTMLASPAVGGVHVPEGSLAVAGGKKAVAPLRSNLPRITRSPLIVVCPHAVTATRNSASLFIRKIPLFSRISK